MKRPIESYEHRDKERVNNPPVGLVTPKTDPDAGQKKKRYTYDPHLEPQLVWAGKAEHTSFEVPTVSLHVHERIDSRTIIEAVRKRNGNGQPAQLPLFEMERAEPLRQAIEFYQHKHGWTNRLIAGDSLLVMNSLLEKEGMAGKVQMIYIDPPYGIKYGSNFQPFVNKRDVKDGKDEDLTSEPEQIRAFRDTWELGIHSYLTYLRDRLLLARELLTESGSIFVQISDENVHHVRDLMDEVFGAGNFCGIMMFLKTTSQTSRLMAPVVDYLVWYAKNRDAVKYRQLYKLREKKYLDQAYNLLESAGSHIIRLSAAQLEGSASIPEGRRFRIDNLTSQSGPGDVPETRFERNGKVYRLKTGSWKTSIEGLHRLADCDRLYFLEDTVYYKRFIDDFPLAPIANLWDDTTISGYASEKIYVVQTLTKVIERCLLMTTDPGDLVFDPTCGSGTTAYVAEQWGRRWITCDTSRVAITIARQRLMTAVFDYYELAHPEEGVGSGFKYKTVPHVTLKSIANNPEIDGIYARMHPAIEQALADLNAALRRVSSGQGIMDSGQGIGDRKEQKCRLRFRVQQGGRQGQWVDFSAPDSETTTLPSGQVVRVNELLEWEVPYTWQDFVDNLEMDANTDKPVVLNHLSTSHQPLFTAFHQARRAMQKAMDEAIVRHAPQETLYDQPFVDRKKTRVSGPFTVEAVPAPAVKSVDSVLGIVDSKNEPETGHDPLFTDHFAASAARSGETLRQAEWREELLKTGIRGKAGQYIRFARLEPLPGCRWLHADGEIVDSGQETVDSERQNSDRKKLSAIHYPLTA